MDFAGYWKGTVQEAGGGRARTGVAFVDVSGDMHLMVLRDDEEPEFVLHGTICCAPRAEQTLGGHRYLETREHDADIDVQRIEDGLRGEFAFRRREHEFALSPDAAYDRPLSLASLAGVYSRSVDRGPGSPWSMSLTIAADGTITGSHSNGCIFNGTASVADNRNLARLDVTLSDCRGGSRRWNGSYRGFGVLLENATSPIDGVTHEDTFFFSLVGPTWLGALTVGH